MLNKNKDVLFSGLILTVIALGVVGMQIYSRGLNSAGRKIGEKSPTTTSTHLLSFIDPHGYFYDINNGMLLTDGYMTVTPPVGGTVSLSTSGTLGSYSWSVGGALTPGIYAMTFTPPPSYVMSTSCIPGTAFDPTGLPSPYTVGQTLDAYLRVPIGCPTHYSSFDLAPGDPTLLYNNIPFVPPDFCTGTDVTGRVFMDANNNGARDVGEAALGSVVITAYTPSGLLGGCRSNADGTYGFNVAAGTNLRLEAISYASSTQPGPSGVDSKTILLFTQSPASNLDIGFVSTTGASGVQFGDRVWNDQNHDGVQDPGEPGISGVNVYIFRQVELNTVVIGTSTTDVDGRYTFGGINNTNLANGFSLSTGLTYRIGILTTDPAISQFTTSPINRVTDSRDSDEAINPTYPQYYSITASALSIGLNNNYYDFGFYSTVTPGVNLSVTTTAAAATAVPSSTISYTLTYANGGTLAAAGVTITDVVPTGTVFSAASSTGSWSCADGSPAGTSCATTIGSVSTSTVASTTFAISILCGYEGFVTNTASITDNGASGADLNTANNSSSAAVAVSGDPDLQISGTPSAATAVSGETLFFTLNYVNSGTIEATGTVLTEIVPTGTIFALGSSTGSWSCADGAIANTVCTSTLGVVPISAGGTVIFAVRALSDFVGTINNSISIADDGTRGADLGTLNNTAIMTVVVSAPPTPSNQSSGGISFVPPAVVTGSLTVATCTPSGIVDLILHSDMASAVAISNSRSFQSVAWQPFGGNTLTTRWQLPAGDGVRTVYAKFRNSDGTESETISATTLVDDASLCRGLPPLKVIPAPQTTNPPKVKQNPEKPKKPAVKTTPQPTVETKVTTKSAPPEVVAQNGFLSGSGEARILTALSGSTTTIGFGNYSIGSSGVQRAALIYGNREESILYNSETGLYSVDALIPAPGEYPVQVVVNQSNSTSTTYLTLRSLPRGVVSGGSAEAASQPLGNIRIALYDDSTGALWSDPASNQVNPVVTNATGEYGFIVPNGRYHLAIEGRGYESQITPSFEVTNNVVNRPISLVPIAVAAQEPQRLPVASPDIFGRLQQLIDDPRVEMFAEIVVVPVISLAQVLAVAPSLSSRALPLIYYIFSQPFLFLGRGKKKAWGVVYDSLTKLPVDLAMVRLIENGTNRVIQSHVTDFHGRFMFFVSPGTYHLEVKRDGFLFPSALLSNVESDGNMVEIYHGAGLKIKEDGRAVSPNIPVDPFGAEKTPRRVLWESRWRFVQQLISFMGVFLAFTSFIIVPSIVTGVALAIHVSLYALFLYMVKPRQPKQWGVVYDSKTKKPVAKAIVRLFSSQFNKLVSTQVTGAKGRYAFLVGPSVYRVVVEHPSYGQTGEQEVDLRNVEKGFVNQDLTLGGK